MATLAGMIRFGRAMLQRLNRVELYPKEANKYADLSKDTTQPDFLTTLFRQTVVRYVLMAEDLERSPIVGVAWVRMVFPHRLKLGPTFS